MEILFQSYTPYSRYIEQYDSVISEEAPGRRAKPPSLTPSSDTPTHLPREKKMRLPERDCCTSLEAWEDGDKRYPGNEVDLEHNDYDVMCLDKMQHEKLLFYISLSFCFWVRSRFCFVFLVWGFVFPFRDLSFCFGLWVFDFACMLLFLGFCINENFQFFFKLYDSILYFVILVLVLPFWNRCFCFGLVFLFGFCGMYFPYRSPYIWPPFVCKSIH